MLRLPSAVPAPSAEGPSRVRAGGQDAGDRRTVLLLMPAAVFAVMVLGALAIDVGLVSLRAQQLPASSPIRPPPTPSARWTSTSCAAGDG